MISVQEAQKIVLKNSLDFGSEKIPFIKSVGRVLKEDILADRDFPPFNRVSMDGIALDYTSFKNGERAFFIEGIQPAGSPQISLSNNKNCIEVMTGAVLPTNTNVVIRYEDVLIEHGIAKIQIEEVSYFQNIHEKGKDRKEGDILIQKNKRIAASEIGVLATVGSSKVMVAKQPKVMIISTGDELVGVNETPLDHQIRMSNVYTLVSLLDRLHVSSKTDHISDDKPILKKKIKEYLKEFDVLLFSGAVSKGKFDFLPEVFKELGVEKLFHKVSQRPGKPFWFGQMKTCRLFAFPGNPISTFANCLAYFYPWYFKSLGVNTTEETAILTENVSFKPNLTYFLQVKLTHKNGHLLATPIKGNGSGDLASLVNSDAFIQLPKDKNEYKKGENYPIIRYR
jgi:molybdopterin molybdotransferase